MKKARIWDARQLPAFLTPKEYGALMNIDPKTVQTMCRKGLLPAHKEGAEAVAHRQECRAGVAERVPRRKARRCWNTDEP